VESPLHTPRVGRVYIQRYAQFSSSRSWVHLAHDLVVLSVPAGLLSAG